MSWFDDLGDTVADWFGGDSSPAVDAVAQYIPDVVSSATEAVPTDFVTNLLSQYSDTPDTSDAIANLISGYADEQPTDTMANLLSGYTDPMNTANWGQYLVPENSELQAVGAEDPMDTANWGRYFVPSDTQAEAPAYDPMNTANWGVRPEAQQGSSGFMDTLNKYGTLLTSPGGQLLSGLAGAGISAYGAARQNALAKEAAKKQAEALAARQAAALRYDSPLRLAFNRQAVAAPAARNGASVFFTNNKLPSYYKTGGGVRGGLCQYAHTGLARGGDPGQSDKIPAMFSPGEYVMDADVVSALGDGNNEAGAKQLDLMRENIRAHKRSAPASSIPPKAKKPLEYAQRKGAK